MREKVDYYTKKRQLCAPSLTIKLARLVLKRALALSTMLLLRAGIVLCGAKMHLVASECNGKVRASVCVCARALYMLMVLSSRDGNAILGASPHRTARVRRMIGKMIAA